MNFIKAHPRLTYLLSGFLMGLVVAGSLWYGTAGTADVLESQIQKLEMELVQEQYQHDQLRTAHKELKTSFKESFEEIIKPDGTKIVRRITDNNTESMSTNTQSSTTSSSKSAAKTAGETKITTSYRQDLDLRLDFSTRLEVGISGYYRVLPPFSVGAGIKLDPNNPNVIKELSLGIGIRL
jgi:hypothetical protein